MKAVALLVLLILVGPVKALSLLVVASVLFTR